MTKKPPISIRLPNDVLTEVDAWANRSGLARNAAIVAMLRVAANPEQIHKPLAVKAKPAAKPAPVKSAASRPKVSLSLPEGVKLRDPLR